MALFLDVLMKIVPCVEIRMLGRDTVLEEEYEIPLKHMHFWMFMTHSS